MASFIFMLVCRAATRGRILPDHIVEANFLKPRWRMRIYAAIEY